MTLKETLNRLITHRAEPLPTISIAPDHVDRPERSIEAEVNRHYFRLWLSEIYLSYDRKWFQTYYPTTSSLVRCSFDGKTIEIPSLSGEFTLSQVNVKDLTHALRLNYALTSLIPLSGDTVELQAVLLAMPGENYLTSFINVMSDFSKLLTVPQLSSAIQITETLAGGINQLLSSNNTGALLGLHQTFTDKDGPNPLKSGYILVPLTSEDRIRPEQLFVVNGRLRAGTDLSHNTAVTDYSYMLFHVEVRDKRENWNAFQNIYTPLQEAIKALRKGKKAQEDAEAYLHTAIGEALLSPDLVLYDRNTVAMKVQACYEEARKNLGLGAISIIPTSLDEIMSLVVPETAIPRNRLLSFRDLFPES